jgi:hypothetical protein
MHRPDSSAELGEALAEFCDEQVGLLDIANNKPWLMTVHLGELKAW